MPHALQQRGLEPAAMLVRSFEVEIGADARAVARLDHEGVRGAAVEPDVEDVVHGLVARRVMLVPEQVRVIGGEPRIRAARAKGFDDALVDGGIVEILAGLRSR